MVRWKKLEKEVLASFMVQCHKTKEQAKEFQFATFGDGEFANTKRYALLIAHEGKLESLLSKTKKIESDGFVWVDDSSMKECMEEYKLPRGVIPAYKEGKTVVTYCSLVNKEELL
jgi:hypothetical protein